MSQNNFLVEGTVEKILPVETLSGNFRKQDFILTVPRSDDTKDYIRFQCLQDRIRLTSDISVGVKCIVHFTIQGRPFIKDGQEKYFNNLDCLDITLTGAPVQQTLPDEESIPGNDPIQNLISDDDLPY